MNKTISGMPRILQIKEYLRDFWGTEQNADNTYLFNHVLTGNEMSVYGYDIEAKAQVSWKAKRGKNYYKFCL